MSATSRDDEPVAPLPIPAEQFAEILRVVRETVRQEMRAEFEGRKPERLTDAELDYVKKHAAAGVAREELLNAEAIKYLKARGDYPLKAQ